jgi:hypothetical protein
MPDFLGLMKQAAELKSKMETMQAELDRMEVEGTAGGGMITLKVSGKGDLRRPCRRDAAQARPERNRRGLDRGRPCRRPPQARNSAAGQDAGHDRRPAAAARIEAVLIKDAAS